MTQDEKYEVIEAAKTTCYGRAGSAENGHNSVYFFSELKLFEFAELILACQALPTPSQSEPVAKYKKEDSTFQLPLWLTHQEKYSKELGRGYSPLFAIPQPRSQDVIDAERYRWLTNNCDGNLQDDFIQWLSSVVTNKADIDKTIDAAMKKSKNDNSK